MEEGLILLFTIFESIYTQGYILFQEWLKLAQLYFSTGLSKFFHSLCGCNLSFEKYVALNSNRSKFPLPRNTFCQVWLKMVRQVWISRFSKFVNILTINFPSKKAWMRHHKAYICPFTQGCSVPTCNSVEISTADGTEKEIFKKCQQLLTTPPP